MTRRRSAMLGVLVLGFVGAGMMGACGSSEPGSLDSCPTPADTPIDTPAECAEPVEDGCMRYRIPLVGDPTSNLAVRSKYIAAFGSACYMSADAIPTFNCFYKTWEAACAEAVKIGEVSGNAAYDPGYTCQPVGNGNYTLQIGSDVANNITIYYEDAPLATSIFELKTVPMEVNGPYRNLVEVTTIKPDKGFYCTSGQVGADGMTLDQRKWILEVNRKAHGGKIYSDLAGFRWPCKEGCAEMCTENLVLKDPEGTPENDPERAQVHHVVPRKDPRGCRWGTNAYKNAAVISARLNRYLENMVPPIREVVQINAVTPYTP